MSVQNPGDSTNLWAVDEYGGSPTVCQWGTRLIQYEPVRKRWQGPVAARELPDPVC